MPTITTTKQEPGRRQTGVKLDTALLREFKILAAKNDTTLGELLEQAMKEYLQRVKDRERKMN
jgi:metal-responsive CopG/Arc/MetJ family transcriptional regulator